MRKQCGACTVPVCLRSQGLLGWNCPPPLTLYSFCVNFSPSLPSFWPGAEFISSLLALRQKCSPVSDPDTLVHPALSFNITRDIFSPKGNNDLQ